MKGIEDISSYGKAEMTGSQSAVFSSSIYRSMSPQKKIEETMKLRSMARALKASGLRMLHPDWSEEEIMNNVNRFFFNAGT